MRLPLMLILACPLAGQTPEAWMTGSVDVGYRWLRFDFHETTNVGALTESGLLVSLSARFSP